MNPTQCHDGRPLPEGVRLCPECRDGLLQALDVLVDLAPHLEDAVGRRLRFTAGGPSGKGHERPLPISLEASETAAWAKDLLHSWAVLLAGSWTPTEAEVSAGYLRAEFPRLAQHEAAAEAHRELVDLARVVTNTLDRPAARWFAGPCGADLEEGRCSRDLYPITGESFTTCRSCGAVHDLESRKRWLLKVAEDRLEPASVLARALTTLGPKVTPSALRGYVHRGRLNVAGHDERGRALFRVGDVLDVLAGGLTRS